MLFFRIRRCPRLESFYSDLPFFFRHKASRHHLVSSRPGHISPETHASAEVVIRTLSDLVLRDHFNVGEPQPLHPLGDVISHFILHTCFGSPGQVALTEVQHLSRRGWDEACFDVVVVQHKEPSTRFERFNHPLKGRPRMCQPLQDPRHHHHIKGLLILERIHIASAERQVLDMSMGVMRFTQEGGIRIQTSHFPWCDKFCHAGCHGTRATSDIHDALSYTKRCSEMSVVRRERTCPKDACRFPGKRGPFLCALLLCHEVDLAFQEEEVILVVQPLCSLGHPQWETYPLKS